MPVLNAMVPNRDRTSSPSPTANVTLIFFFGLTSKERPALLCTFALMRPSVGGAADVPRARRFLGSKLQFIPLSGLLGDPREGFWCTLRLTSQL